MRTGFIWAALILMIAVPIGLALSSPLLAWRDPVYRIAGAAGVFALSILLIQPLLAAHTLPLIKPTVGRHLHRWFGAALTGAIVAHVAGLWMTSPPDVIDALLFASPTPFAVWGVVAMWAVVIAGLLAVLRKHIPAHPKYWRLMHSTCVVFAVVGSVVHALLIEGTMEPVSKAVLCGGVIVSLTYALRRMRLWAVFAPKHHTK